MFFRYRVEMNTQRTTPLLPEVAMLAVVFQPDTLFDADDV